MKRLLLILMFLATMLTASAHSIRYFTYSQVSRTVSYLNAQNELMIYCGYPDEIETYVLLNEVWAERVNSKFYEIWIFGYDAYTGEEIYMPVDLECVWLPGTDAGYYNAAQYLRFRTTIGTPSVVWCMPVYNRYTRIPHVAGHPYTYQWEIHRQGWRRPAWDRNTPPPYPPYYMRDPGIQIQPPTQPWTPGVNRPAVPTNGYAVQGQSSRGTTGVNSGIRNSAGTVSTNTSRNSGNSSRGNNSSRNSNTSRSTGTVSRGTSNTNTSRSTGTSSRVENNTNKSTSRTTGTSSRGTSNTGSNTTGTSSRGTSNTGSNTSRTTGTSTRSTNKESDNARTVSKSGSSSRSTSSTSSSSSSRSTSENTSRTTASPRR